MTKLQLIQMIQGSLTEASRPHVPWVIEAFMRQVKAEVARGTRIDFRGFGSFAPVMRKAKPVRSGKGLSETKMLPANMIVRFKPAPAFTEMLQQLLNETHPAPPTPPEPF